MKKKLLPFIILFAVILIAGLVFRSIRLHAEREIAEMGDELPDFVSSMHIRPSLNEIDSLLFYAEQLHYFKGLKLIKSDTRNAIWELGNDIGYFVYTSFNLNNDISLDSLIIFRNEINPKAKGLIIGSFRVSPTTVGSVDTIICSYEGSPNELYVVVDTPDFKSYYINASYFGLRYGENEPTGISFKGPRTNIKDEAFQPVYFAFYKKDSVVYFLSFMPYKRQLKKYKNIIGPDYLQTILNENLWGRKSEFIIENRL